MADAVNRNVTKWFETIPEYSSISGMITFHDFILSTDMIQVGIERSLQAGSKSRKKKCFMPRTFQSHGERIRATPNRSLNWLKISSYPALQNLRLLLCNFPRIQYNIVSCSSNTKNHGKSASTKKVVKGDRGKEMANVRKAIAVLCLASCIINNNEAGRRRVLRFEKSTFSSLQKALSKRDLND